MQLKSLLQKYENSCFSLEAKNLSQAVTDSSSSLSIKTRMQLAKKEPETGIIFSWQAGLP